MGTLALPRGGTIYLDSNIIIYSAEHVAPFESLIQPIWDGARSGAFALVTSELSLIETLVVPLRNGDGVLEAGFRSLLSGSRELTMLPITLTVIERALLIRATNGLQIPDAIHAATAIESASDIFVTNDSAFRRVSGLPVTVLSDLL